MPPATWNDLDYILSHWEHPRFTEKNNKRVLKQTSILDGNSSSDSESDETKAAKTNAASSAQPATMEEPPDLEAATAEPPTAEAPTEEPPTWMLSKAFVESFRAQLENAKLAMIPGLPIPYEGGCECSLTHFEGERTNVKAAKGATSKAVAIAAEKAQLKGAPPQTAAEAKASRWILRPVAKMGAMYSSSDNCCDKPSTSEAAWHAATTEAATTKATTTEAATTNAPSQRLRRGRLRREHSSSEASTTSGDATTKAATRSSLVRRRRLRREHSSSEAPTTEDGILFSNPQDATTEAATTEATMTEAAATKNPLRLEKFLASVRERQSGTSKFGKCATTAEVSREVAGVFRESRFLRSVGVRRFSRRGNLPEVLTEKSPESGLLRRPPRLL